MSRQEASSDHITADRLREIAVSRQTLFTNAEFLHVQVCSTCFNLWNQYMKESESKKDRDSK
jgi:hypothetical protein